MTDDGTELGTSFERIGAACIDESEKFILGRISEYVERGASVSQATDMYATGHGHMSAKEWARETDRKESSVRSSVRQGWSAVEETETAEETVEGGSVWYHETTGVEVLNVGDRVRYKIVDEIDAAAHRIGEVGTADVLAFVRNYERADTESEDVDDRQLGSGVEEGSE